MMAETDFEDFDDQVTQLEDSLSGAQSVASTFAGELSQIRSTMSDTTREVKSLSSGISRGLRGAFEGLVFDGMRLSDVLRKVGGSMMDSALSSAVNPLTNQLGKAAGAGMQAAIGAAMPFADGGAFSQGRVRPFASGGIVSGPTTFPMRGGTGLMGEAGPEAIMPLSRGADGKLGVATQGGGRPVNVVMNITTSDAGSFQRSQSQIAARMSRAIGHGQRNR